MAHVRRRDDGVRRFDVDGTATLYLGEPSRAVVLNETATAIWDVAGEVSTIDEIVARLARRYGESPDAIGPQVDAVLRRLAAIGLVTVEPEP